MKLALVFLLAALPIITEAREVIYGKARETVVVAFGNETIFRFPMEVKTITQASRFDIHPANPEEPDYSVLIVKPRFSEGSADVVFMLADGSLAKTELVISNRPNAKKDTVFDFKPRDELLDTDPTLGVKKDPMNVSELDLMRAMIQGDNISGFDASNRSQSIPLGSDYLSATLVKIYTGKDVNGYIYKLEVESGDRSYEVDLKSLSIGQPNLALLSQIDRNTIGGGKPEMRRAYLRVVAKPGAASQKIILPVTIKTGALK